jgi:hypothetical protein
LLIALPVSEARNLPHVSSSFSLPVLPGHSPKPNPYAMITLDQEKVETTVQWGSDNPFWGEQYTLYELALH